jgi:hypothetical protein
MLQNTYKASLPEQQKHAIKHWIIQAQDASKGLTQPLGDLLSQHQTALIV